MTARASPPLQPETLAHSKAPKQLAIRRFFLPVNPTPRLSSRPSMQCQTSLPTQWMSLCRHESSSCRKPRLSIVHCCLLHRLAIFYRPLPRTRTFCPVLSCAHVTNSLLYFFEGYGWSKIWGLRCSIPPSLSLPPSRSLPLSLCVCVSLSLALPLFFSCMSHPPKDAHELSGLNR